MVAKALAHTTMLRPALTPTGRDFLTLRPDSTPGSPPKLEARTPTWPARSFGCPSAGPIKQDFAQVLVGKMRTEHQEAGEVELTSSHRVPQGGKAADQTGGGDAAKGLVFGEAQLINAVRIEARTGTDPVDAARLDLAEVGEQGGEQLVGAADEASRGSEQLGVAQLGR
jgi:hypothetical protein